VSWYLIRYANESLADLDGHNRILRYGYRARHARDTGTTQDTEPLVRDIFISRNKVQGNDK